ncbi:hypothetical protein ABQJ54_01595 [Rhodanobacter sp. Si-c]|uniref:HPr kinase n=1 Tax=Rhodanobacter lycopersici TaxID=3162487 RepID=A0ABV3Q9D7_9GAMM
MKKIIFGKCYAFSCDAALQELLAESLSLYVDADGREPEVNIHVGHAITKRRPSSINPSVHDTFEHGMLTSFPSIDVYWERTGNGRLNVEVAIKPRRGIRRLIHRLLSMEYPREIEVFEQVLHEFVLVPSVYFFQDVMPIHAASVMIGSQACLLAGTGGSGKSSAMLALRRNQDAGFVSDDIVVMSANARVYGNMAWPKIYGYNCIGNAMKREILAGRSWVDRAHFSIKNRLNSANVRRKMSPDRLYPHVESTSAALSRLYYLVREDVPDIRVSALDPGHAIDMTIAVVSAEYSVFHDHLYWEKYNALATMRTAMLTMEEVTANWRRVLSASLAKVGCFKISIPLKVDHAVYEDSVTDIIVSSLTVKP